jgi:hypothetical protein
VLISDSATTGRRRSRAAVHVGLVVTSLVSLAVEPVLTLHILLGLAFVALVVMHLLQRRRTSMRLLSRMTQPRPLAQPIGRLALSDALLAAITAVMLASGLWDWLSGHPTRTRWHAIAGAVLAGLLVVHTVRRRRRLMRSNVR